MKYCIYNEIKKSEQCIVLCTYIYYYYKYDLFHESIKIQINFDLITSDLHIINPEITKSKLIYIYMHIHRQIDTLVHHKTHCCVVVATLCKLHRIFYTVYKFEVIKSKLICIYLHVYALMKKSHIFNNVTVCIYLYIDDIGSLCILGLYNIYI